MLLLTSTSDIVRVVTGQAVSTITVNADFVDNASGTITLDQTNTAITTATTTTVVASPGASTQRNVRGLRITNNHASSSCQITVQHYDGTTSCDLIAVTLLAGENVIYDTEGQWRHNEYQGSAYVYSPPARGNLGITGTLAETMPREWCPEVNTALLTSGTLRLQAIYLYAGQLVSNIIISSATTAAGTPTNWFFALYSVRLGLLAQSANQTTTAWAANTVKTLAMTTAYRVPVTGCYYIGLMVTATTVPTIKGGSAFTQGNLSALFPATTGISTAGLTTALPNPAAVPGGATTSFYAAVS